MKKTTIAIATVFNKLQTLKILVRPLSKKRRFRTRFDSQHVKACQILAKSPKEGSYHVFSSLSGKLIWKMSPLVLGEILLVFVNTLTLDDKYHVQDSENLQVPFQRQFSEKGKTFSEVFVPFLEATSNFKSFEKKDDPHS